MAKTQKMNTREIRMQHYVELQNLDKNEYDKNFINDNLLDYDYLHDPRNYRPLGQRYRPFNLLPSYARREDWEHKVGLNVRAMRFLLGVICLGLGYKLGTWDSKDELLASSNVVEFESED
mmetsp:Transcript_16501/g.20900  ORF Transcript_16501/g.20900 Transcript_16501/m.20900 type:complete len:120 (+) Transcript_16501:233-592(+)